jgi:hypothetical protein
MTASDSTVHGILPFIILYQKLTFYFYSHLLSLFVTIQRVVILARDWPESSAMDGKRLSACLKVTVHGTGSRHPCRDDGASE